jgi:hypothetical protein
MNFATMLMQTVTPLFEYQPKGLTRDRSTYNTKAAAGARSENAKKVYWNAMRGKNWQTTTEIEHAVGYHPRTAEKWLGKAWKWGLVEKRRSEVGKGWQWKWVQK